MGHRHSVYLDQHIIGQVKACINIKHFIQWMGCICSAEGRPIDIDMVKEVAKAIRIPFAVGGGISTLQDMYAALLAGAEKVSVNSLAVRQPDIIAEGAKQFGSQCIVLGVDPDGYIGCGKIRPFCH